MADYETDSAENTEDAPHILELVDMSNVATELDDRKLTEIGARVVTEYEFDKNTMKDWLERNELASKLIDMRQSNVTDPWPGAAGTKLPLVLNAAMKASAEEFAEIMRGTELVHTEVFGSKTQEKAERSIRVSKRMNHQFLHELDDWEADHDKLIMAKNILGTVHKKVFHDSGETVCILRRNGVIINDNVEKLKDAPRVSDEIDKLVWEVEEKVRLGEWAEIELTAGDDDFTESDKMHRFIEQIRREDLDGDGYPEPYIVTVHEATKKVVRIVPNYTPESIEFDTGSDKFDLAEYEQLPPNEKKRLYKNLDVVRIDTSKPRIHYIKYTMIPSWEGGYWDFGFGILLAPLNDNCNKLINQLLNQGHLQAKGGGFIGSNVKLAGGTLQFRSNEWKKINTGGADLSRSIVPLPVAQPSTTLYQLLGTLMDVLKELSSVTEVMSGDQPKANMPATSVLALIEQGKKMFNSVYKRHYRALAAEMTAVFDLNFLYQDPAQYAELLDIPPQEDPTQLMALVKSDFSRQGMDLIPTANPEYSSKAQRMAEGQAMFELKDDPRVNGAMVLKSYVELIVDDKERAAELVPDQPNVTPEQQQQQIQEKLQEFLQGNEAKISQAKADIAATELQMKQVELQAQGQKVQADQQKRAIDMQKAMIDLQEEMEELKRAQAEVQRAQAQAETERLKGQTEAIRGQNERMRHDAPHHQ